MIDTRGHRSVAWAAALALALLVGIFPQFALGALGPQLRVDLGLDAADLGLIFAGLYALGVLGSPIAGPIVDRIGGRRGCLGLLLVAAAALLLAAAANSRGGLLLAMVPAGAAMAFANPATNRWASSAATPRQQAALVGIAQAGVQAGALGAGLLAAATAVGLDWRTALRIGAVLGLVGAMATLLAPRDHRRAVAPPRAPEPAATSAAVPSAAARDARRPPAPVGTSRWLLSARAALTAYALLMGAGTAVVFAYLPSFAVDVVGLSLSAAGATTMVFGTTALICRLGIGVVLRTPAQMGAALLTLMALGSALSVGIIAAAAEATVWVWVGAVTFGATGTTWPAVAFLAVVRASPPGSAGRVTGWVTAGFYLGLWLTPPIAGRVIAGTGYTPVWAGAAVLYLAAVVPPLLAPTLGPPPWVLRAVDPADGGGPRR